MTGLIVAAVDWTAIAAVAAVIVAPIGSILAYRQGTRADQSLSLSKEAERRSKETETNLSTQGAIIDQLQEEVKRYREDLADKHGELERTREAMRDLRHELGTAQADLQAARIIIAGLEQQIVALQATIAGLEMTVDRMTETITSMKGHT